MELKKVYESMKKFSDNDIFNCTACGYFSCKVMAMAIFNNLNKPENCLHYNFYMVAEEKKHIEVMNKQFHDHISDALDIIGGINNLIRTLDSRMDQYFKAINESSKITEDIADSLKTTAERSRQKQESIISLTEDTAKGQQSMEETIQSVQGISQSVDGISQAIKIISTIAANTNLLSMNAAIEAAHAGIAGRGFAVVADEIRRLSESTRANSHNISQTLSNIIQGINVTVKCSDETNILINSMSGEINDIAKTMTEMIGTMSELSAGSHTITSTLKNVQEHSSEIKTTYADMISKTNRLLDEMNDLTKMTE
jgi:methyl-accepting chemotaxis protein